MGERRVDYMSVGRWRESCIVNAHGAHQHLQKKDSGNNNDLPSFEIQSDRDPVMAGDDNAGAVA
jgi:hypothetical protein